jgi:release factor glutamine methyltransferase
MDIKNASYYMKNISEALAVVYSDEQLRQQYAWWMLQALCEKTKIDLLVEDTLMLSDEQKSLLAMWIKLLVDQHMPIQYILGSVPFNDLDILVQPPTLIPRPETEEWCLHIIEHLMLLDNKKITILDLATGSGCIALALAYHVPQAEVVATDIADTALALAEQNIEHTIIRNVTLIKSDLFDAIPVGMLFDIIVSNPPYIAQSEWFSLDATVTKWEDHEALVAADDGLAIIKKIIKSAPQFIKKNDEMKNKQIPQIVIEIGYQQGDIVKQLMQDAGYNDVLVQKDLEKKDRFVVGRVDYVADSRS